MIGSKALVAMCAPMVMSSYKDYLVRRFTQNIFVLFGVSILIFTITRVIPGSPVRLALGPQATTQQVNQLREEMGFNDPLYVQYIDWVYNVVQGQWGRSLRTSNDVLTDILLRLPATIELVLVALTIAIVLAIPFGVIAGTNKDDWPDHLSRIIALTGVSMPRFWVAILLQVLFVVVLGGLLPLNGRLSNNVSPPPAVTSLYLIDSLIVLDLETFIDALKHIILPATALGLSTLAQVMRLIRSEMIEEARKDYVLAARSYGLPKKIIEYKYMLKNSFTSALTIIGLAFGFLIGNAFLVEIVFSWPGAASYGVDAILYQDLNAIVGIVMVTAVAFTIANFVVDILYGYLDPRVRFSHGGGD